MTTQLEVEWSPRGGALWGGSWHLGSSPVPCINQENGRLIGYVTTVTPPDVDDAVTAIAHAIHDGPQWLPWQRRQALGTASQLLQERRELFAWLISQESSKPICHAKSEVTRASETLRLSAEQAGQLTGETLGFDDSVRGSGRIGWYTREPLGVVAAVTPFNDPLNLIAHKVGPALVSGNGVVVKPADQTPLTALAFAELLLDAGVPADRFAVLPGDALTGSTLVEHPLIDVVSFTGGYATGVQIARASGAKKTLMELGGNGSVLVLDDADLELAAQSIVDAAFGNTGQNCLSAQRIYVSQAREVALTDRIVELTRALRVGTKDSPETDVGPLITEAAARRVEIWVDEAVTDGAKILTGGVRAGVFYAPTVLSDVPPECKVLQEEVFGPVLSIVSFESVPDAVAQINASPYALHAGMFTTDLDAALVIAQRLRVGGVMINDTGDFRIDSMPFGGGRRSGIGREGVRYAVEAMTEPKIVAIRTGAGRARRPFEVSQ